MPWVLKYAHKIVINKFSFLKTSFQHKRRRRYPCLCVAPLLVNTSKLDKLGIVLSFNCVLGAKAFLSDFNFG